MTAYTLHPLTVCKPCKDTNPRLEKAQPKAVDFMQKRCDMCRDWIKEDL